MTNNRLWIRPTLTVVFLFFIGLFLSFQNCGGPPPDEDSLTKDSESTLSDETPFAFDASVDQITYMSCSLASDQSVEELVQHRFFTFRVGAYDRTGLKLNQDFLNYVQSQVGVGHSVNHETLRSILENSKNNRDVVMQVAIRPKTALGSIASTGSILEGVDYSNIWSSLTAENVLDTIFSVVSIETPVNYLLGGRGIGKRRFEASLYFNESEDNNQNLRKALINTHYLTLTYNKEDLQDQSYSALSPQSFRKEVNSGDQQGLLAYGRGYKIDFEQVSTSYINNPKRVLKQIEEIDLTKEQTSEVDVGLWDCDSSLRLKIVNFDDKDQCSHLPDPLPSETSSDLYEKYQKIRKHLFVEDWFVNLDEKCVVPKGANPCYSREFGPQYDFTKECETGDEPGDCSHFVSFCFRQ